MLEADLQVMKKKPGEICSFSPYPVLYYVFSMIFFFFFFSLIIIFFRFIPWADSPYNTEPILEQLEKQGQQGNKVLLEGIKTGSAKVSVR